MRVIRNHTGDKWQGLESLPYVVVRRVVTEAFRAPS